MLNGNFFWLLLTECCGNQFINQSFLYLLAFLHVWFSHLKTKVCLEPEVIFVLLEMDLCLKKVELICKDYLAEQNI